MWCALWAAVAALASDPSIATPSAPGATPGLPAADSAAVRWQAVAGGARAVVPLQAAPFPHGDRPWSDRSVWLFVPEGHDPAEPVDLLVHLHGFEAELATTVPAFHLEAQVAGSGEDWVLVVPQGPVNARDGDFGKLMEPGGLAALVDEVMGVLSAGGHGGERGRVRLSAHSGGYRAVARGLDHGGVEVHGVFLFDALYGERATFRRYVLGGGQLTSSHTATGGTRGQNRRLLDELVAAGLTVHTDVAHPAGPVVIGPTPLGHVAALADGRLAAWLSAVGDR